MCFEEDVEKKWPTPVSPVLLALSQFEACQIESKSQVL